MNLAAVNLLNIVLMLVSLGLAMRLPFETFLLAYAVLGPAHYLTEISWLHDRQYFTPRRHDWVPLVALCAGITALNLVVVNFPQQRQLGGTSVSLMLFAFGFAAVLVLTRDRTLRWTFAALLGITALFLHGQPLAHVWVGIYLPTIVHVALFTGAFVCYGALKSRSATGHLSLLVFVACAAVPLLVDPGTLGYGASDYARAAYQDFIPMHAQLASDTGQLAAISQQSVFSSPGSLQVARFIAFAYTYHYFNWFSKTSVIRWHEVSKRRILAIAAVWAASVALYAFDYRVGLRWLLFLSYLHVLLEFPLNHQSFLGIGRELLLRVRPATRRAPA